LHASTDDVPAGLGWLFRIAHRNENACCNRDDAEGRDPSTPDNKRTLRPGQVCAFRGVDLDLFAFVDEGRHLNN
jgi:hypothetical protein